MMRHGIVRATWGATWAVAWLLVACVGICVTPIGCRGGGVLADPVVIGASVSAGVSSGISPGVSAGLSVEIDTIARTPDAAAPRQVARSIDPAVSVQIDLATALDASLVADHGTIESFADAAMLLDPVESLGHQVDAAKERSPTCVFAIDALFWCVYAPCTGPDERLNRLDAALTSLATLTAPLILGDIPDLRGAVAAAIGDRSIPTLIEIERLNDRIAEWAAARPNVMLVALSELLEHERRDTTRRSASPHESLSEETRGPIVAADGMHLTAEGELALARVALSALVDRGLIPASAVCLETSAAFARLRPPSRTIGRSTPTRTVKAKIARETEALALERRNYEALRAQDAPAAAEAIAARFAPEYADLRSIAAILECKQALQTLPRIRGPLLDHLRLMAVAASGASATNEELFSLLDLAMALDAADIASTTAVRLAPRVASDLQRSDVQIPSAGWYALRAYDWHVAEGDDKAAVIAVTLFSDPAATASTLRNARSADARKARFAASAGFAVGVVPRTPEQELARFADVLTQAGRAEDARIVRSIAMSEKPR